MGVRAAVMPAIVTAADEARVPAVLVPPTPPATPAGTAAHQHPDQNGVVASLPEAPAALGAIGSPSAVQTPPALHTYSWGSRVRTELSCCSLLCSQTKAWIQAQLQSGLHLLSFPKVSRPCRWAMSCCRGWSAYACVPTRSSVSLPP